MDHHIDIRAIAEPDLGITEGAVLSALVQKLHLALVDLDCDDIGITLPNHRNRPRTTGNILRLHGPRNGLHTLAEGEWHKRLSSHLEWTDVLKIPATTGHRVVRRARPKHANVEQLRARRMRRHGITYEEARSAIPDTVKQKPIHLPYVQLRSRTTGQPFSLFIHHGPIRKIPESGRFNTYGLSDGNATLPWF